MQVYVYKDQETHGPYTRDAYNTYLENSVFDLTDLVCVDGKNWITPFSAKRLLKETAKSEPDIEQVSSKKSWLKKLPKTKALLIGTYLIVCLAVFFSTGFNFLFTSVLAVCLLIPFILFKFLHLIAKQFANYKPKSEIMREEAQIWLNHVKNIKSLPFVHSNIILKNGECAYYSEATKLYETRAVRHYQSGFAGFRVMKGVYVGGSKGKSVSNQEWSQIDSGTLVITNKRIIFDGFSQNRSFDLRKVMSVSDGSDYIEISIEGRQKSVVFICNNPIICASTIHICTRTADPSDLSSVKLDIEIANSV